MFQIGTVVLALSLIALGFQNCGQTQAARHAKALPNVEQTKMINDVRSLAAADLSCVQDSDCTHLRVQINECKSEDVVASRLNANFSGLQELALEVTATSQAYAQSIQAMCTMEYMLPPIVSCVSNLCQRTGSQF